MFSQGWFLQAENNLSENETYALESRRTRNVGSAFKLIALMTVKGNSNSFFGPVIKSTTMQALYTTLPNSPSNEVGNRGGK